MFKILLTLTLCLATSGCGGGGKSGLSDAEISQLKEYYANHNKLAEAFVTALNATGQYTVSVAKTFASKSGFIVIYDQNTREYSAVNIANYTEGANVSQYLSNSSVYNDLDFIPGYYSGQTYPSYDIDCSCVVQKFEEVWNEDSYRDRNTGLTFEKSTEVSKDVEYYAALAEEAVIVSRSTQLSKHLGLSVERSIEVVRLAMVWEKNGGKNLTLEEQNFFSEELLGFSITEARHAMNQRLDGKNEAMDSLVERASLANNISPEHVRSIMQIFGGERPR